MVAKQIDHWQIAANACEMLAFSLKYPTAELADAIYSGEWLEAAKEITAAINGDDSDMRVFTNLAVGKNDIAATDAEELLHVLRAEATRLFVNAPVAVVSPYEGMWRAEDDDVQPLLFVNPHSMEVERFVKACGLGRPEGTNEPLDHIATEFELLEYLSSLAAGIAAPVGLGQSTESLPGGQPEGAYEQFLEEHVLVWVPRFSGSLAQETRLPYYRAVSVLLDAFVDTSHKAKSSSVS